MSNKTISVRNQKTVWTRYGTHDEQRATAILLAYFNSNKFSLYIVFKSKPLTSDDIQEHYAPTRHRMGVCFGVRSKTCKPKTAFISYRSHYAKWCYYFVLTRQRCPRASKRTTTSQSSSAASYNGRLSSSHTHHHNHQTVTKTHHQAAL